MHSVWYALCVRKDKKLDQNFINSCFNDSLKAREARCVSRLVKDLTKKGFKVKTEVWLNHRSRPDIVLTLPSKKIIIIECKSDDSTWSWESTQEQVLRYHRTAKRSLGPKYLKTILASPKGKYGVSFPQLHSIIDTLY